MAGVDEDILICIFNYRHDENARRWKSLLSKYFRTVVLDSGNDKFCPDFIQYPNIYYSGLWNETKRYSSLKKYLWAGIITSDVLIDDENAKKLIDRIKWLKTTTNLGVWSIVGDINAHSNGYVYAKLSDEVYFRCFEGFFQFINTKILSQMDYIDTTINLYGHGIDYLTCFLSDYYGFVNKCDDDIYIYHPKDKGYDRETAKKQQRLYAPIIKKKYPSYKVKAYNYKSIVQELEKEVKYIKKKCVYTCITGNYDVLRNFNKEDGWDYVCFTDMKIDDNLWIMKNIPEELNYLSKVKQQRIIKILPQKYLPEYDFTLWLDANIILKENHTLTDFFTEYNKEDKPISFKIHPIRDCIYQEFDACLKYKKDTSDNMDYVRDRYLKEGFPEHFGLYETGIILRNNKDRRCCELMELWAKELKENSHRDQLSLNYCIWKLGYKDIINEFTNEEFKEYFILQKHIKNNYLPLEVLKGTIRQNEEVYKGVDKEEKEEKEEKKDKIVRQKKIDNIVGDKKENKEENTSTQKNITITEEPKTTIKKLENVNQKSTILYNDGGYRIVSKKYKPTPPKKVR